MAKTVENYITELNNIVSDTKKSGKRIFEIYADASKSLTVNEMTKFKKGIDMDKSTIRKMKKICESTVIIENMETLPASWGTLYTISTIEEKQILQLIKDKKLHSRTTKWEVMEIKEGKKVASASVSNISSNVATQSNNSLTLILKKNTDVSDKGVVKEVNGAIHTLEKYFDVGGDLLSQINKVLKEVA